MQRPRLPPSAGSFSLWLSYLHPLRAEARMIPPPLMADYRRPVTLTVHHFPTLSR
ncbi:hypothetical protein TSUD_64290 [Trifolium subterraneum]|uniref:Uncharacterized protein n=1 Tax=Trifolium subterraneum TaxID=3900 RepID=A0A2Z6MIV2_TRISU|nr:hypothetical protein TSUD_64290 [Trifolium subterraneum]